MQKPFICLIIFCAFLFSSCSEDNRDLISEKPLPVGEPIVGKPIILEEVNSSSIELSVLKPDSYVEETNNSKVSNERIIEEGLVVNGVPIPNDLNETIAIIPRR